MTPQAKVEGEIQLALVDAWDAIDRALGLAAGPAFGRTALRREWVVRVKALRGCVLLAAGRLIDVAHIEAGVGASFASRRERTVGESSVIDPAQVKRFALLCPMGFPEMRFGLGRLAGWIAAGEAELVPFFGLAVTPRRAAAARRVSVDAERQRVIDALAVQDAMLSQCGERARVREESERAAVARRRGSLE